MLIEYLQPFLIKLVFLKIEVTDGMYFIVTGRGTRNKYSWSIQKTLRDLRTVLQDKKLNRRELYDRKCQYFFERSRRKPLLRHKKITSWSRLETSCHIFITYSRKYH